MGFLDRFRRKGEVEGNVLIRDMPAHHSFMAFLKFVRVSSQDASFPGDSSGAPFHKCDYSYTIKDFNEVETEPLEFKLAQPVGYYYVWLDVWVAQLIDRTMKIQMEAFLLSKNPIQIVEGATMEVSGGVDWPSVPIEELHDYGKIDVT